MNQIYYQWGIKPGMKRIVVSLLMLAVMPCFAQTSQQCQQQLTAAQRAHAAEDYRSVISLLDPCKSSVDDFSTASKIRFYDLLARAYLILDYPNEDAELLIDKILDIDDQFQPDASENNKYVEMVKSAKDLRRQSSQTRRRYFLIAAGVAATGLGYAIYRATQEDETPIGDPPAIP